MTESMHTIPRSRQANPPPLVYNGEVIHERREMLSLTDMWKAAGSPEGRRPSDWRKDSSNQAFLDHVALIANAPVEGIWEGRRGAGGGTWAHWQIAMAYAKYLAPEFHVWCNKTVRERMEGPGPSVYVQRVIVSDSREARLSFKQYLDVARMMRLEGSQAVMAANQATFVLTGIDMLDAMGITHAAAPQNEPLLTPTEIGRRLGTYSARDVNRCLCQHGYQAGFTDARGARYYELTDAGKEAGGVFQDTRKRHSDGAPIRQLRWASSIVQHLQRDIERSGTAQV